MEKLTIFTSNCQIKKKEEYIQNIFEAKKMISDKDAPILACGMLPDIDYLITSDKEFFEVKSDKITILSPRKHERNCFDLGEHEPQSHGSNSSFQ